MNPAEVLAVEIKQYVSRDTNLKTLVPRIIGQAAKARDNKSGGARSGRHWDRNAFRQELEARSPEAVKPAEVILEWAESKASRLVWGKGKYSGTFSPTLDHTGTEQKFISAKTDGSLSIWFGDMRTKPPFSD